MIPLVFGLLGRIRYPQIATCRFGRMCFSLNSIMVFLFVMKNVLPHPFNRRANASLVLTCHECSSSSTTSRDLKPTHSSRSTKKYDRMPQFTRSKLDKLPFLVCFHSKMNTACYSITNRLSKKANISSRRHM